jgi:hypothetical protein
MKNAASIKTFGRCHNLGIDVSKATLEVVGLAEADVWKRTVDNQLREIEHLAQALTRAGYVGNVRFRVRPYIPHMSIVRPDPIELTPLSMTPLDKAAAIDNRV